MDISTVFIIIALTVVASVRSASVVSVNDRADDDNVCNTDSCKEAATWLIEAMNKSVDPCENFFQYACGGWVAKNPVPPSEKSYTSFDAAAVKLLQQVKDALSNPPPAKTNSKSVVKSQDLFRGCVNMDARKTAGTQPVKDLLNEFGGWPLLNPSGWKGDDFKVAQLVARVIRKLNIDPFVGVSVWADIKNTESYILLLDQPEFMAGRNQMVNMTSSERTIEIINAYKQYIAKSAELLGATADDSLKQAAEDVVNFESEIAKYTRSNEERRDPNSWYHKMKISELQAQTTSSSVNWKKFFDILLEGFDPAEDSTEILVMEPDYMKKMIDLAEKTDVKTLANYFGWRIVSAVASFSTPEFREAKFEFEKVKSGITQSQPLYKICATDTIELLGFAVGRLYVEEYLGLEAKNDVEKLVENLRDAYRQTLLGVSWMDDTTKNAAVEKLNAMINMLAYPEWITNDEKLDEYYANVGAVSPTAYFQSRLTAKAASVDRTLKRWNQKTSKSTEWISEPPVVDAFYNPSANTITFPAGILQTPFYKFNRIESMNYGGIGMAIGHEMSHGFDDQGSQYDKEGNLKNWWSEEVQNSFKEKAKCFQDQYSKIIEPTTGLHLNGENTLGENIADNGAIRNSYKAYKMFIEKNKENNEQNKKLPGLDNTSDQLFFLSYASLWCGSARKEHMEEIIQYDPHSPAEYRIIVPLTNSEDFAKAFNCPEGSAMNPKERCVLW